MSEENEKFEPMIRQAIEKAKTDGKDFIEMYDNVNVGFAILDYNEDLEYCPAQLADDIIQKIREERS